MIEFIQAINQLNWPAALVITVAILGFVALWRS